MKLGGKKIKSLKAKDILKEMKNEPKSSGKTAFLKESLKVAKDANKK